VVAIILPQVANEFNPSQIRLTLPLFVGLIVGAAFWGVGTDLMGRQLTFNLTLFIATAFGIATGGGTGFIVTEAMIACVGLGTGGNLLVAGAIFLEFVPGTHQYLLTMYTLGVLS
jgi:MFS family permease